MMEWIKLRKVVEKEEVKKLLSLIRYEFLSHCDLESISKCGFFSAKEFAAIEKRLCNNQNTDARKPRAKYREE